MITKLDSDLKKAAITIEKENPKYVIYRHQEGIVEESYCCHTSFEVQKVVNKLERKPGQVKVAEKRRDARSAPYN